MTMSALDYKGQQWRDWIVHNLQRGCSGQQMIERMVAADWPRNVAVEAIEVGTSLIAGASSPQSAIRPDIDTSSNSIDCGDRVATVLLAVKKPRIVYLDGVLTIQECDDLIDAADGKGLKKSAVVDGQSGDSIDHHARSSNGTFFTRGENALVTRIEQRLARVTRWPSQNAEGLQILHYGPEQEYRPHFDWFNEANPGSAKHLQRGGQRLGTFILYLSDVAAGGMTIFPKLGIEVFPRKGAGVFFADADEFGQPDQFTLHGGAPVVSGVKIIATYWQRADVYR